MFGLYNFFGLFCLIYTKEKAQKSRDEGVFLVTAGFFVLFAQITIQIHALFSTYSL